MATEPIREDDPSQNTPALPSRPPAVITHFPKTEKPPTQGPTLSRRRLLQIAGAGGGLLLLEEAERQFQLFSGAARWLQQRLGLETDVPPVFDNTLNEGVIGDNNILHLSLPEINQRFPQQVMEEGNFLYFLSPIVLPDGTRMPYGKKDVWEVGGANYPTEELNKEARKQNIKDNLVFTIPAGGYLVPPVDGYGYINLNSTSNGQGTKTARGFFVVYHDEIRNKTYKIWLFPEGKDTNINLVSLVPNLEMPPNKLGDMNWPQYPRMERGQRLIQATGDQKMRLVLEAYNGDKIGVNPALVDNARYLLTPRFLAVDQKLVALGK